MSWPILAVPVYLCWQVSWHWKGIVELDQQWMPKCLKLGWCINFAPTPFEHGVWKRHYIETVLELHIGKPKVSDWGPGQCIKLPARNRHHFCVFRLYHSRSSLSPR